MKALDGIVTDVVAPAAAAVDRDGTFPRKAIEALGSAAILGLTVPTAAGGVGGDLRDAAVRHRDPQPGLWLDRHGRAHALRGQLHVTPSAHREAHC